MAKTTPGLEESLGAVRALGKQFRREARADYRVALSASTAGQANLLSQLSALQRGLVGATARQTAALGRLTSRAKAGQRQTLKAQVAATRAYGSALGGAAAASFAPARAAAREGAQTAQAAFRQGVAGARTAGTVAGILTQGAAEQGSAAQYALAQALQQRTIIDNQTLAQLTGNIYSDALNFQRQQVLMQQQAGIAEQAAQANFERQKELVSFQFDLSQKEIQEQEKSGFERLQATVDVAGSDAYGLMGYFNDPTGEYDTPAELAKAYADESGISREDTVRRNLIFALTNKMWKAGAGNLREGNVTFGELKEFISSSVLSTFSTLYPQFTPSFDVVNSYLDAKTNRDYYVSFGGGLLTAGALTDAGV